jgi:hypothetical protein
MVKLAVLVAVAAVAIAVRWWMRRYDALGRRRRFPTISVALLSCLAVALVVPAYLRHREESRLSAVATALVGTPVVVHCQTFGQQFFQLGAELGYVRWGAGGVPERQTFIKHGPCGSLRDYLASDKQHPGTSEIIAVHVLTHESMHMRGIKDEAQAECAALQRDAQTAQLLGADRSAALALARIYWLTDYPRMSDTYRSPDCAPGGALDEHLPDPPWAPRSASGP